MKINSTIIIRCYEKNVELNVEYYDFRIQVH